MIDPARLLSAYDKVRAELLAERTETGHWEGRLSSSALATATAVSALAIASHSDASGACPAAADHDARLIERGIAYLVLHQNPDGGWGDTDKSHSNIATTMLAVAALHLARDAARHPHSVERAHDYLARQGGLDALSARYGTDKTFAVPILTNYALAGLVDWSEIAPLPFEWACLPQRFYRWAQLPVVSYAIPALVAIGQARYIHCRPRSPLTRLVRHAAIGPSLRVLERMQPRSGGYLEAVPLTSFVAMSLASSGRVEHPVTRRALQFLRDSIRPDGSWPIDTNLATWATSLAIHALSSDPTLPPDTVNFDWLLACQHRTRHPFTGADPGGWGWTDLSGAVPDADDTAGALLACGYWQHWQSQWHAQDGQHWQSQWHAQDGQHGQSQWHAQDGQHGQSQWHGQHGQSPWHSEVMEAARCGVAWLLGLQNRDGGWPTFCRGWGKLPFDRSGADLTAHALRALYMWRAVRPRPIERAIRRGWSYLQRRQRPDGSWVPLWFGQQDHPDEENPVYGTARVLLASDIPAVGETEAVARGYRYLAAVQREDGGWGGGLQPDGRPVPGSASSVEETAVVVESLLGRRHDPALQTPLAKGLQWLTEAVLADQHRESVPIGFYFAKLWYYEKLYPLVFAVAALGRAVHGVGPESTHP